MPHVEHVLNTGCELGEGPVWHEPTQTLYWVDIYGAVVHRLHPATGQHHTHVFDDYVSTVAFRQQGGFLLAMRKQLAFWDGVNAPEPFLSIEADKPHNRCNDGAVDAQGRFWFGTMNHEEADCALYRLDPDLSLHTMETGLMIANGLGWSPDGRTLYHTDSPRREIYAYDFDADTGQIAHRRVHIAVSKGYPDGLTVDAEGYIWGAHFAGWGITRYTPDGALDQFIELPVEQVTSLTFGGPDLRTLYITTAREGYTEAQRASAPQAGDLFRVTVTTPGRPEPHFAG